MGKKGFANNSLIVCDAGPLKKGLEEEEEKKLHTITEDTEEA